MHLLREITREARAEGGRKRIEAELHGTEEAKKGGKDFMGGCVERDDEPKAVAGRAVQNLEHEASDEEGAA